MTESADDQPVSDDQDTGAPDQSDEQSSWVSITDESGQQAGDQATDNREQLSSQQTTSASPDSGDQTMEETNLGSDLAGGDEALPEKTHKTGDCSGWERDPQSFAKVMADYYLRTELGAQPALVKNIWCPPDPIYCIVAYQDGREVWVTLKYQPDYVIARGMRPLPLTQRCFYGYDCTTSGELVFTKRSCDLYPDKNKGSGESP